MQNKKEKTIWFRRKTYGWGWTPNTWQGWLVTILYSLGIFAIFFTQLGDYTEAVPLDRLSAFAGITFLLLAIVWRTGEAPKFGWKRRNK
jgi:hypothetical protein